MTSIPVLLFAISPIVLLLAAETLIRKRSSPDALRRRNFLLLAWTGIGLLWAITISTWLMPSPGNSIPILLAPALTGILALLILHLPDWKELQGSKKNALLITLTLLILLGLVGLTIVLLKDDGWNRDLFLLGPVILAVSLLLAFAWRTGARRPLWFGMLALLYMAAFNLLEGGALPLIDTKSPAWLTAAAAVLYVALPGLVISTAAMLFFHAFNPPSGEVAWRAVSAQALLAVFLLGSFVYTLVWLCIWDGTDDGVRGILMIGLSILAAVAGGMLMLMASHGWRCWIGAAFAVIVIGLVWWTVAGPGNQYRPYDITERRAAQITQALEKYHARTGWYPFELSELVPDAIWRVPRPMIIPGEAWCYQGGSNFYRLGVIYREHWSHPDRSVKIYASAGNVPEEGWACDEKLAGRLSP